MKAYISLVVMAVIGLACSKEPELTPDMLDSGKLMEPSLYQPAKYLVSRAIPNPTAVQAQRPVIIACHGYTATTFEWDEFRAWAGTRTDFYLSQVLLGSHGRSYDEFKKSTWRDWQTAITEEYDRLEKAGYRNISLLGSSTSGALLLELLQSGYFTNRLAPRRILLVDPIVIPSSKTLSLIGVVGPMLGYIETEQSAAEDKVYYHFRPQETLRELNNLTSKVRKALEKGITLPATSTLHVYKSVKDSSADPVSAVLIQRGVRTATGGPISVELVDSDLHVYTRLQLRSTVSEKDKTNQTKTFADIAARVLR